MTCARGHRVVDSTGEHYTLRETDVAGVYEYVAGDCDEVEAALAADRAPGWSGDS